ncbi:MAG: hypothetical protein COA72_06865 [Candidatus Neomarinimicrobiota bacterium]|nr:MAG: hypothetical protein COA72_06865 [Candidatus Neomarinimicrobiota bacterium]
MGVIFFGLGQSWQICLSVELLLPPTPPIGMFSTRPNNVIPLQKAIEMAGGYNYQLWKKLK